MKKNYLQKPVFANEKEIFGKGDLFFEDLLSLELF